MSHIPRLTTAFALVAFASAAAGAQETSLPRSAEPAPAIAAAPVAAPARDAAPASAALRPAPAGPTHAAAQPADASVEAAYRQARARDAAMRIGDTRSGKAYMIIGGAAFLAGAIIGDDAGTIIMIAGAGIGIYGLYLYLL